MQKKSWRLEILDAPPLEQNTMHRSADNKGSNLGGTGTVGSGYRKMNKPP